MLQNHYNLLYIHYYLEYFIDIGYMKVKKVIIPLAMLMLLNSKALKSSDDPFTFCPTCQILMQLVGSYYICSVCDYQKPLMGNFKSLNSKTKKQEELSSEACAYIPEIDNNHLDVDFTPYLTTLSDNDFAFMEVMGLVQSPCFEFDTNGFHLVKVGIYSLISYPGEYIISAKNDEVSICLGMIICNQDNIRLIIDNQPYQLNIDQLEDIIANAINWNFMIYSKFPIPVKNKRHRLL